MRVEHVEITEYSGSVESVRSATREWPERRGLLLRITRPDGIVGQGEASPLPGYSPDTLGVVREALGRVEWRDLPEPDALLRGGDVLAALSGLGATMPSPSARFALETALLDIAGQRASRPIWHLLEPALNPADRTPLSAFVGTADDPDVVSAARAAVDRGVRGVKLKVTGPSSSDRLARIFAVRDVIGDAALRLDANRSLRPENARGELETLRDANVEFIEEPVDASSLDRIRAPAIPIALDESLQDERNWLEAAPRLAEMRCVALVLKPATLGGFVKCSEWRNRAREHGLEVTISHVFDGPVALTAAAHLAAAMGSRRFGSGLDVHGGLEAWPDLSLPLHSDSAIVPGDRPGLGVSLVPRSGR